MKKIMFNDRYGLTQAVLDGKKTMTRRVFKPAKNVLRSLCLDNTGYEDEDGNLYLSKYKVGEIVAVAQSYETVYHNQGLETIDMLVSGWKYSKGWKNKMFVRAELMPHRIRIINVRVERLQDISDEDCVKEGILWEEADSEYEDYDFYSYSGMSGDGFKTPREAFASLIDKISGRGTWQSNPWVWVYEFELVK